MAVLNQMKRGAPLRPSTPEYEQLSDLILQLCDLPSEVKRMTDWEANFVDEQYKLIFDEKRPIMPRDAEHIRRMAADFKLSG